MDTQQEWFSANLQHVGVLVACWLKCWPAIERLQVQAPIGTEITKTVRRIHDSPHSLFFGKTGNGTSHHKAIIEILL